MGDREALDNFPPSGLGRAWPVFCPVSFKLLESVGQLGCIIMLKGPTKSSQPDLLLVVLTCTMYVLAQVAATVGMPRLRISLASHSLLHRMLTGVEGPPFLTLL